MKNLIISLGGCGNNIINLLQDKKSDIFKTLSIQRELQLLSISNADFKLNQKDGDFEQKLKILLENSNDITLISGLGGTNSILYLDKLIEILNIHHKKYNVLLTMPSKYEDIKRQENANRVLKSLLKPYEIFYNDTSIDEIDKKIIDKIGL